MTDSKTILVVDDDDVLRLRLEKAFNNRGLTVYTACEFDDAIELVRTKSPDMAVLDLKMPGRGGMELLKEIKDLSPSTQVIMLTGYGSITNAVEAVKLGALNYVTKPADADQVLSAFGMSGECKTKKGKGYRFAKFQCCDAPEAKPSVSPETAEKPVASKDADSKPDSAPEKSENDSDKSIKTQPKTN